MVMGVSEVNIIEFIWTPDSDTEGKFILLFIDMDFVH